MLMSQFSYHISPLSAQFVPELKLIRTGVDDLSRGRYADPDHSVGLCHRPEQLISAYNSSRSNPATSGFLSCGIRCG